MEEILKRIFIGFGKLLFWAVALAAGLVFVGLLIAAASVFAVAPITVFALVAIVALVCYMVGGD